MTDLLYYVESATTSRKISGTRWYGIGGDIVEGRLTTESGVAVSTSDRTAQGTIYFTPFNGNRIRIYDGTRWQVYLFAEKSLALSLTSGKNYDVFIYDNATVLTLELSAAWTTDTARADALTTQDGVTVKSGATTRRWLGTIRASGANIVEDSAAKRFVWNARNRVRGRVEKTDSTSTWNYTTATYRSANNSTANRVEIVTGDSYSLLDLGLYVSSQNDEDAFRCVGIDEGGTSSNDALIHTAVSQATATLSFLLAHTVKLTAQVSLGYHFYQWTEYSTASGTTAWYGTASDPATVGRSGLNGTWEY